MEPNDVLRHNTTPTGANIEFADPTSVVRHVSPEGQVTYKHPKVIQIKPDENLTEFIREITPSHPINSSLYSIENKNILHASSRESCVELNRLLRSMEGRGSYGKLAYEIIEDLMKNGELGIVGTQGNFVLGGAARASYTHIANKIYAPIINGRPIHQIIVVPEMCPEILKACRELSFYHEGTHAVAHWLAGDPTQPLNKILSPKTLTNLGDAWTTSVERLTKGNPYVKGSPEWRQFRKVGKFVFQNIGRYPQDMQLVELLPHALSVEMRFPGVIQKFFPEYDAALMRVIHELRGNVRSYPTGIISPAPKIYMCGITTGMSERQFELVFKNAPSKLPTAAQEFKQAVEQGLAKGWAKMRGPLMNAGRIGGKGLQFVGKGLEMTLEAKYGIPLQVAIDWAASGFSTDPKKVAESFSRGTATWAFDVKLMGQQLGRLCPPLAVYYATGVLTAHAVPENFFKARADALPTDEEIESMYDDPNCMAALLHKQEIDEIRERNLEYEYTYRFFRKFNGSAMAQSVIDAGKANGTSAAADYIGEEAEKICKQWAAEISTDAQKHKIPSEPVVDPRDPASPEYQKEWQEYLNKELELNPDKLKEFANRVEEFAETLKKAHEKAKEAKEQKPKTPAKDETTFWDKVTRTLRIGTAVANGALDIKDRKDRHDDNIRKVHDEGKEAKEYIHHLEEKSDTNNQSYLRELTYSPQFHSPDAYFTHLHEIAQNNIRIARELAQKLEANKAMQGQAMHQLRGNQKLQHDLQKMHERAIKEKQEFGRKLGGFFTVVKVIGEIAAVFNPAVGIAVAGSAAVGERAVDSHVNKFAQKEMRAASKDNKTMAKIAGKNSEAMSALQGDAHNIQLQQAAQDAYHAAEGHKIHAPDEQDAILKADQQRQKDELAAAQTHRENLESKRNACIATLNAAQEKTNSSKKKRRLNARKTVQNMQAEVLQLNKQIADHDEGVEKKKKAAGQTERALEINNNPHVRAARQVGIDIVRNANPSSEETAGEKKAREETEIAIFQLRSNSHTYDQLRAPYNAAFHGFMSNLDNLFRMHLGGNNQVSHCMGIVGLLWEAREIGKKMNDVTLPGLSPELSAKASAIKEKIFTMLGDRLNPIAGSAAAKIGLTYAATWLAGKYAQSPLESYIKSLSGLSKLSTLAISSLVTFVAFDMIIPLLKLAAIGMASRSHLMEIQKIREDNAEKKKKEEAEKERKAKGLPPKLPPMEQCFADLSQLIGKQHQALTETVEMSADDISKGLEEISLKLMALGEHLFEAIDNGFKNTTWKIDSASYNDFTSKIEEQISRNKALVQLRVNACKDTQNPLMLVRSAQHKEEAEVNIKELENSLILFEQGIQAAAAIHYNKDGVSGKDHGTLMGPISFIPNNSPYYSNFLSHASRITSLDYNGTIDPQTFHKIKVPNVHILVNAIQDFIDFHNRLFAVQSLKKQHVAVLYQGQERFVREKALNICNLITTEAAKTELLFAEWEKVLDALLENRKILWEQMDRSKQQMRGARRAYEAEFGRANYERLNMKGAENRSPRERSLQEEFVGSQRFYWTQLTTARVLKIVKEIDLKEIHDAFFYSSPVVAGASRIVKFTGVAGAGCLFLGALGSALGAGVGALFKSPRMGAKIGFAFYEATYLGSGLMEIGKKGVHPDTFDVDNIPKLLRRNNRVLRAVRKLGLKEIVEKKDQPLIKEGREDFNEHFITGVYASYPVQDLHYEKKEGDFGLGTVRVDTGVRWGGIGGLESTVRAPQIRFALNDSLLASEDLKKVPEHPGYVQETPEAYDGAVKALMNYYYAYLDWVNNKTPMGNDNPFKSLLDEEITTVFALESDLDLVFPNELIKDVLENKELKKEIHFLESTKTGSLIPFYTFKHGRLLIEYHFVPKDVKPQTLKNRDGIVTKKSNVFTVAEVDLNILRCYQKDLSTNITDVSKEFLITLMYASFGNSGLGIPGSESHTLKNNAYFAPKLVSWPGLFKMWQICPEKVCINSPEYTKEMSERLFSCIEGDNDPRPLCGRLFRPYFNQRLGEGFADIWLDKYEFGSKDAMIQAKFSNNYMLFIALTQLLSDIKKERVMQMMEEYFGIANVQDGHGYHPDIVLTEADELKEIPQDITSLFRAEVHSNPSAVMAQLKGQVKTIEELNAFITSTDEFKPLQTSIARPSGMKIAALVNIHNSCYINSVLQSLARQNLEGLFRNAKDTPFVRATHDILKPIKGGEAVSEQQLIHYRGVLFEPSEGQNTDFVWGLTAQKDAVSLLEMILDNSNYKMRMNIETERFDAKECKVYVSDKVQDVRVLGLPLAGENLTDALREYFVSRTAALSVTRCIESEPPEFLVLQVLRFNNNPNHDKDRPDSIQNQPTVKLDGTLKMPEKYEVNMSRYFRNGQDIVYEIDSVINHHGTPMSGHYTVDCRNGNEWVRINDDMHYPISEPEMSAADQYAYILRKK